MKKYMKFNTEATDVVKTYNLTGTYAIRCNSRVSRFINLDEMTISETIPQSQKCDYGSWVYLQSGKYHCIKNLEDEIRIIVNGDSKKHIQAVIPNCTFDINNMQTINIKKTDVPIFSIVVDTSSGNCELLSADNGEYFSGYYNSCSFDTSKIAGKKNLNTVIKAIEKETRVFGEDQAIIRFYLLFSLLHTIGGGYFSTDERKSLSTFANKCTDIGTATIEDIAYLVAICRAMLPRDLQCLSEISSIKDAFTELDAPSFLEGHIKNLSLKLINSSCPIVGLLDITSLRRDYSSFMRKTAPTPERAEAMSVINNLLRNDFWNTSIAARLFKTLLDNVNDSNGKYLDFNILTQLLKNSIGIDSVLIAKSFIRLCNQADPGCDITTRSANILHMRECFPKIAEEFEKALASDPVKAISLIA